MTDVEMIALLIRVIAGWGALVVILLGFILAVLISINSKLPKR